eukprot:m.105525 g.105525  ORF g.105525 m.105525 type:complete len:267 (+) comp16872_c0_seq4:241-1041(+)
MADVAWEDLLKLHEKLQAERAAEKNSRQSQAPVEGTHDRIRLLVARAKRYEAERKVLYEQKSNFGSPDSSQVVCSAQYELEEVVRSSTEAADHLTGRIRQAETELERELRLNEQQKKLHEALQSKVDAAQIAARGDAVGGGGGSGSHIADLRRRVRHASQQNQALLTAMGAFIDNHFPELRASDIAAAQGATSKDTLGRYQTTEFTSFMGLLEDLMNQCVASPENPYITIDEKKHWQPYIEFILRWGIGVKDPRSPNRLKLTEYHI